MPEIESEGRARARALVTGAIREVFSRDYVTVGDQACIDPHDGAAQRRGWDALLARWAGKNEVRRTESEINLDALARGLTFGGRWGEPYNWPEARWACDHPSYFRRGRYAAAILVEPYNLPDFEALLAYAPKIGLVAHTPPNPLASFWYPGFTRLIVLTRPDFGEVRWLPDQLSLGAYLLDSRGRTHP